MKLFCITNDTKYRIINILGIKLRFRSKYLALQHKVKQLEDELMTCKENIKCAFLSNYYSGIPTKNPKDPWHKHLIKFVTDSYDIIDSAERNANRVIVYMTEQTQETGLADRIRTMTTAYIMAAEAGRDFYIYHDKGFKLEDYLLPNEVDWRISQDNISKGINKVSFLFLYSRFQKLTDTGREWHIYQSNNIIDNQFLPDALKDKYSDASVFRKLFRIHPDLLTHAAQVMENMGITEMEELLQTYGATKADIFWKLKLPTALPNFFSAIKMAIPLSVIGAAIAEWLGAQEGLGYFSKRMMTQLDGAGVFAPVVLLSITAMLAVGIITVLEYRFIKWRKEI